MTRPTKYRVSQAELEEYAIPIRVYTRRRNAGWTHEQALRPIDSALNHSVARATDDGSVDVAGLYSISDHITIRQLARRGMSMLGLSKRFTHIPNEHIQNIVNGHNYCGDE